MPRYSCDTRSDEKAWLVDPDGMDLVCSTHARRKALVTAAELAKNAGGWHSRISVRIRDSHSEPLLTVTIAVAAKKRDLGTA
ncbi:DUF6894 family protein [Microvirga tunisiensis]|uniref:DUF6894 family protein n=1 Tax=Microvirga tunisiensis TaxID=2108360 RepID=UPI003B847E55